MSEAANDEDIFEKAATFFEAVRQSNGVESLELRTWLEEDTLHREAYEQTVANWKLFDIHDADPEVLRLREEGLADARRAGAKRWQGASPITRRALAAGLVAAFVAPSAAAAWWFLQSRGKLDLKTGTGEQRTVLLADASRVFLDANTQVRVRLQPALRHVEVINGRAHFEVAKDPRRPFRVSVGEQTVTAVGTAFTVETRHGATNVLLTEGAVVVDTAASAGLRMKPGDELVVGPDHLQALSSNVDIAKVSAWQSGKLFFDNETLAAAADRMNDYSKVKLSIQGNAAQRLRISGMFVAGEVGPFVDALQAIYPIQVHSSASEITVAMRS